MSLIFATQLAAVATLALAVLALATAVLALLAWRKQSKEVSDQAEMLDLQRRQLAEQEKTSAKQAEVLELQAQELRSSLDERKREAEEKRRGQAALVAGWFAKGHDYVKGSRESLKVWGATIRNASDLPIFDVRVFFHYIAEPVAGLGWEPVSQGSSTQVIRVLAPQSERHVMIPGEIAQQMNRCDDEVYAVSIWFTDGAGNRWERDPRGALKPLDLGQAERPHEARIMRNLRP